MRNVQSLIWSVLKEAVTLGYVTRNVASLAKPPLVPQTEMRTWNAEELRGSLEHVHDDRLYAWLLLAMTGMRRGEGLGLHWRSVDLDSARVSVNTALVLVGNGPACKSPRPRRAAVRSRSSRRLSPRSGRTVSLSRKSASLSGLTT